MHLKPRLLDHKAFGCFCNGKVSRNNIKGPNGADETVDMKRFMFRALHQYQKLIIKALQVVDYELRSKTVSFSKEAMYGNKCRMGVKSHICLCHIRQFYFLAFLYLCICIFF